MNLREGALRGVALIKSKAGSCRSNHWHRGSWHWLYVLSGQMEYWERPLNSREEPKHFTVREGEMVFTGPEVEHTTRFPVDTVLISLSSMAHDHALHETDVVRLKEPLG